MENSKLVEVVEEITGSHKKWLKRKGKTLDFKQCEKAKKWSVALQEILHILKTLEGAEELPKNPYPESIFKEPTLKQYKVFNEMLEKAGLSPDGYNGSFGRKVWRNCFEKFAPLLLKYKLRAKKAEQALAKLRGKAAVKKISDILYKSPFNNRVGKDDCDGLAEAISEMINEEER